MLISLLKDGVDWSGRSGRLRYALVLGLGTVPAVLVEVYRASGTPVPTLVLVFLGLWVVPAVGYTVRRFHDTGTSGLWIFLNFIPYLNILVALYLLLAPASDRQWKAKPRIMVLLGYTATALLAASVISRVFWTPFWVPSGNMKPTLLIGDYFYVAMFNYAPEHGDIVVYQDPIRGASFIARIIAQEGEKVQVIKGVVHIDGVAASLEPQGLFQESMDYQGPLRGLPRCTAPMPRLGEVCNKRLFLETLPSGHNHFILDIQQSRLDDTEIFLVPDGHVFVMGDNRDNSIDSRISFLAGGPGMLRSESIIGPINRLVFSSTGQSLLYFWTWRSDRFFHAIN